MIRNKQKNENEKKILTRENCENARNIASYNNAQSNIPVPSFEGHANNQHIERKSPHKNHNRELNISCEKNFIGGGGGSNLRDKFRKFETSPYNNIKNRSNTTTIITAAATFRTQSAVAADAHESVGENRRIYDDDDKNSNFSTSLINCDERQRLKASAVQNNSNYSSNNNNTIINKRCKFKFVNDSNNNQVKSSLPITSTAISAYKVGDETHNNNTIYENLVPQTNILTDNDFSYIDSSSISRSSSTSFKSDEISVNEYDENLKVRNNNLRKYQIPKRITRISCDNNNHTRDDAATDGRGSNKRFEIISTNENFHRRSSIVNQSPSVENSVSQLM